LAKGAAPGGSILTLVKATLIAMKTKTIAATVITAVVVIGTSGGLSIIWRRPIHQKPRRTRWQSLTRFR
jgi:hypothetical protein